MKKMTFLIITVFAAQLLSASYAEDRKEKAAAEDKKEKSRVSYKHDTFYGSAIAGNVHESNKLDDKKAE